MNPPEFDFTRPWFHGSPLALETLLPGSTITQDEALARAFSHKPQLLALEDDEALLAAGARRIRHNGLLPGILYQIDEPLGAADVFPHPRSSMAPGLEWLTRRPLKLRRVGPVEPDPADYLSP
jgi:hypothetical protein